MNKTIEPNALMSRLMTFVFAGAVALTLVLILAVVRITPLQKTHVFFLTTTPHDNLEITLQTFPVNDQNIEIFKENFAKEYITARNEIFPHSTGMQRKWRRDYGGQVFSWSSADVYDTFANTRMVSALLSDIPAFDFRCYVNFRGGIQPRARDRYGLAFTYSCTDRAGNLLTDTSGQVMSKDYTIVLTLQMEPKIRWDERLRNPLGVRVIEYTVESGGTDPLDFEWN